MQTESAGEELPESKPLSKKIESAWLRLNRGWFPHDPETLATLQELISAPNNNQVENRSQIITHLKSDLALYTRCVQTLIETQNKSSDESIFNSPAELLRSATNETLSSALNVKSQPLGIHALQTSTRYQIEQVKRSIVSSATAEFLSKSYNIDNDLAFSSGVLRQLGMILIAYNSPAIFKRAVVNATSSTPLELVLTRMLGFSPSTLSQSFGRRWSLTPEIRYSLGDRYDDKKYVNSNVVIGETLHKLCQIGEALAHAVDNTSSDDSRKTWAKHEIEYRIGARGYRDLCEKLHHELDNYLGKFDTLEESTTTYSIFSTEPTDVVSKIPTYSRERRYNQYLSQVPEPLSGQLTGLYTALQESEDPNESLDMLINYIIPSTSFTSGIIYLIDPKSLALVPKASFGRFKAHTSSNGSVSPLDPDHPVLRAFKSRTPIVELILDEYGFSHCLTSALGNLQRLGVLLLEFEPSHQDAKRTASFKAITQALEDCLGLY